MTTDSLQADTTTPRPRPRRCNSLHCGPARRTAVYRLYDRNQRLLYVGIAHDTKKRWRQHARDKDWWKQVHWYTAAWHNSRLGAAIEEYCAFRYENPIHNKARDYDRRLGWEPGDTPGNHQPRPWRLGLLASAMTLPDGGISWDDADPHYAVVRCSGAASSGAPRIWFPQIPELGYWDCHSAEPGSRAAVYRSAANVLTERYGLKPGSFTLSLHDPDGCPEPELEGWVAPVAPPAEIVGARWWHRGGAKLNGVRVAVAILEVDILFLLGVAVATAINLARYTHADGLLAAFGLGAAGRPAVRWLLRHLRAGR